MRWLDTLPWIFTTMMRRSQEFLRRRSHSLAVAAGGPWFTLGHAVPTRTRAFEPEIKPRRNSPKTYHWKPLSHPGPPSLKSLVQIRIATRNADRKLRKAEKRLRQTGSLPRVAA